MAQGFPQGLYSGGAVVVNDQPMLQYILQQQAHKQAKDEALSRYYMGLGNQINQKGMRQQDIEGGFAQKLNDFRNFYMQNSDAIKNPMKDNQTTYNKYMGMYQDLLTDTQKSQNEANRDMEIGKKMLDPNFRSRTTSSDLAIVQNRHRSIYDPQFYKDGHTTPYGEEDFSFSEPDFDSLAQQKVLTTLKGVAKPEKIPQGQFVNKQTGITELPYIKGVPEGSKKNIGDLTGSLYDGNKSMQSFFENSDFDPDELKSLNELHQKYYGKPISSPRDISKAWGIKYGVVPDERGTDYRAYHDPNATLQRQEQYYDYRQKNNTGSPNNWADDAFNALQSGDQSQIENAFNVLNRGAKKDVKYVGIKMGSGVYGDNMPTIIRKDRVWVPDKDLQGNELSTGNYKDVLNATTLDPKDPALYDKLIGEHQRFLGSDKKLVNSKQSKQKQGKFD